ncbi:MAG: hypothetical protein A3I26_00625 [Candidatus Yanofskybacteria bacterium RIFCSPLOWO2_02_FULL_43_10]|uniref:GtrA/DPMS transmembrane domain-containing protein n=1 Tax=Candidatus Yanofskybacteria bacterium RIFCSPLOWO2_12_FULL_43_11b TaxID=1802710 RepID=A0A1F8H9C0_9BACT|nr:MAG: hypothetical protein A2742_00845 [Candidatus Yanofskybacteria bacterium RIFCSPHIGHO2_01_FULL_43_32]OGN11308.1 MAG: hypothetical protein A3C69_00980 [Candidatus Yanofskybacteria bacterium RIFCSPHIGHO2_02_FULL_43_12]OGN17906.1 MAG: hypothetical protein A3E34_03015 [Candidatus Yanofskybacteria bacterium RIFCSPHIGHO2_12_FULL_43_11]OGN24308.1 MAG: hypothetical protein A2923_00085 [Candidatus Yanofskybacteria bacterium RIFCSPLOWO2_01_FULL_43_46]OGN29663.1 MAG: hypothetical protein A3I26_00625
MRFTKKDFYFSVITGCITGFSAWRIFEYLAISEFGGHSFVWFLLIVPVLWILGVNFGYFLGGWFGFFNQFGKFAAIGFTNAAVDFGVLNLLIANTGISSGGWYPVFKGISFMSAIIPSYFWNKYWAFEGSPSTGSESSSGGFEFAKFMSVAVVAIFINIGTASLIVNYVNPLGGLSPAVWANAGAVVGSAVALIFSFVGFKLAVFKK